MTKLNKETPISSEHLLLKKEVINDLDIAVRKFQDGKATDLQLLQLLAAAINAWKKATQNPILKPAIEKELRKRRMALHQMAQLDIVKQGDPIQKRYNPNYWLGTPAIQENPQAFLLDRIDSLRNLFGSLYNTSYTRRKFHPQNFSPSHKNT